MALLDRQTVTVTRPSCANVTASRASFRNTLYLILYKKIIYISISSTFQVLKKEVIKMVLYGLLYYLVAYYSTRNDVYVPLRTHLVVCSNTDDKQTIVP